MIVKSRHGTWIFLAALLISIQASSQVDSSSGSSTTALDHDQVHFYLLPQVGIPSEEMKQAVKNDFGDIGVGFSTGVLINPFLKQKPSPVFVGIDFGYLTYGVDKIAETPYNPPLKTAFNIYTLSAEGRLMGRQREGFTPFVDGMIGVRIFNTRTRIDKDIWNIVTNTNQPEVINTTNDEGLNYTLGIGFFNRKSDYGGVRCSFMLRLLYSWGSDAKYVIRDSVALDASNNVVFQTGYTKTNMFQIQLGILLY